MDIYFYAILPKNLLLSVNIFLYFVFKYKFISVLSEKYAKIAKDELREEEGRKSQSLQQFSELIKKHPYIKNCRTGIKL